MKFKIEKLEHQLKSLVAVPNAGGWHIIQVHPNVQWKQEVNADDTLLGYEDWLKHEIYLAVERRR